MLFRIRSVNRVIWYTYCMKHIFACAAAALFSAGLIGTAFAFTEPTGTPPTRNVPAPLNVGAGTQEKAGGLVMQSMKAASITLGESTRTSWLDAASSCNWEGWKCDCRSDGSSVAGIAMTFGAQCSGGQLQGVKIVSLSISSRSEVCSATAPAPCRQSFYTYANPSPSESETTLNKTTNVLNKIICLGGLFC